VGAALPIAEMIERGDYMKGLGADPNPSRYYKKLKLVDLLNAALAKE
jgi:hypothetical protein